MGAKKSLTFSLQLPNPYINGDFQREACVA